MLHRLSSSAACAASSTAARAATPASAVAARTYLASLQHRSHAQPHRRAFAASSGAGAVSSSQQKPSVLVVGGSGALGSAMIDAFGQAGWRTLCMDFRKNPSSTHNITLSHESTWKANLTLAEESLNELLGERFTESTKVASTKKTPSTLSVVVHCAGSWLGGDIASSSSHASAKDSDSFLSSLDPMLDLNLRSAVSAAHLAGRFLSQAGEGMLVVTGAAAVTKGKGGVMAPTPSMLAYGMSKAATHQLAMSLAEKEGGLKNATVVCVLPTMIDTPSNRSFAPPTTDFGSWTPPAHFAEIMVEFAQKLRGTEAEAENQEKKHVHQKVELKHGGFYRFETKGGKTHVTLLPH